MRGVTRLLQVTRTFSANVSKTAASSTPADPLRNVVGLTGSCVKTNEAKNVPGAGQDYKVPEYFGYNRMTYHEAECEMEKFRVPQPVAPRNFIMVKKLLCFVLVAVYINSADSCRSQSVPDKSPTIPMEEKLSLSTHILDTTRGKPATNVKIKLYKLIGGEWIDSKFNGVTDEDGRIRDFPNVDDKVGGIYKLHFEVINYFQRLGVETLYPFVEIPFTISSSDHYHIPLLLNPFGYSTYRGS
ncbi:CLUMA_CG011382, isoform A [Clunio marinus]|uniref:hydroxyisourate hydrolase n=1 Tax=Clunio marinus TaxID=568069 RepID=A0A1J1ICK3_9DIPT|nr:CLUMA_CG011382, isoform A [Clunio marinus]